jgi:hypothetical protein
MSAIGKSTDCSAENEKDETIGFVVVGNVALYW